MKARLYLDEDVLPELARFLRSVGQDVLSAHEVGALGLDDEEQLARAAADGRALFSFNYRDFLRISREWFLAGRQHSGIIISYRQYKRAELGDLARGVLRLLDRVPAENLENLIWVLIHSPATR